MFVGELEFSDLPFKDLSRDPNLTIPGYLIFLGFVFLIVVVMMNLLNGLAVSDTGEIRREAETHCCVSRVRIVCHIESMLLGNPLNMFPKQPSYLAKVRCLTYDVV